MAGVTIECGLSVSVESSPRTPSLVSGINRSGSSGFYGGVVEVGGGAPGAPLKKRIQNPRLREISSLMLGRELTEREEEEWADIEEARRHVAENEDEDEDEENEESISPRVLFQSHSGRRQDVARRLDFYSSGEWSPIPLPSSSSASASVAASVASWEAAQPIIIAPMPPTTESEDTVGDCSVCYLSLPKRSNHVFTACGHLFCVKCMLVWWDTSSTCAMCRAEILDRNDAAVVMPALVSDSDSDSVSDSGSESEQEEGGDVPNFQDFIAATLADNNPVARRHYDDDSIGGRQVVEPPQPIPTIDQYLHIDADVNWASSLEITNPDHDDWAVVLTRRECANIHWNRALASMLWARRRFNETLFSNIVFLGETFHTFIPKTNWLGFSAADMGPHRMFEFVLCRTNAHTRGHETNFFGYISRVVIVQADNPVTTTTSYDAYDVWENTNEYAFVVGVFNPTTAHYDDAYDIEEGTFITTEMMFRFADIRRMYSIQSREMCDSM
jgi:hypothetical protein